MVISAVGSVIGTVATFPRRCIDPKLVMKLEGDAGVGWESVLAGGRAWPRVTPVLYGWPHTGPRSSALLDPPLHCSISAS